MKVKSILFSSFLFSLFAVSAAHATCMATCSDTDAGQDPRYAGVVVQKTSCSPPGGPVNTSNQQFFDRCENGLLSEYSCQGQFGASFALKREYRCLRCDPVRQGVCLKVQGTGIDRPIDSPTYSWSERSGSGPQPDPELPPTPVCPVPMCAAPPEGCRWSGGTAANGCTICGELICSDRTN